MFGHDDHDNHDENNKPDDEQTPVVQPTDTPTDDSWQHPGPPPTDNDSGDSADSDDSDTPGDSDNPVQDIQSPSHPNNTPPAGFSISQNSSANDNDSPASPVSSADNDLIDLKQEALTKLSPLVGHLDQTPDEKFRTLMMMIQASDDQRLVKQAYETALKIDDEKERAQALLDIVNEINYFTQNPGNSDN